MKYANPKFQEAITYVFIPISFFILFKIPVDNFISFFVVKPLLTYCYPSSFFYDIVVVLTFSYFVFRYTQKLLSGAQIPFSWYCFTLTYTIIYLTYRIENTPFPFTGFKSFNQIKLLDLPSAIPLILCFISLLIKHKKSLKNINTALAFMVDEPRKIAEDDLFNRKKFIDTISSLIENTNSENGSFPIGVVAAWGSGKTTFLNSLKLRLSSVQYINVELNVWKCNSANQIVETLFNLLRTQLHPYSYTINSKLQHYANSLLSIIKNESITGLKNFADLLFPAPSIVDQFESINSEIKQIGKKIIVLIDDIDRLDKNEIYEVIKLIRNTASFSNTFFIVAYDRNYILNAIEDINPYQSHLFLEKIFQLEFTLPPIDNVSLQAQIDKNLKTILTENGLQQYNTLRLKDYAFYANRKIDLTNQFILNMRDVIRFTNSFRLSYQFVKDEVDFIDFYNIELIRFKHPELFLEIFRNRESFFYAGHRKNYYPLEPFTYALAKASDSKKDNVTFVLSEFLKLHIHIYKLSEKEIHTIVNSFTLIFPQHDSMEGSLSSNERSHLSVVKPSMFDRYYKLGIEGKLSEVEFGNLRNKSLEEFTSQIGFWSYDEKLIIELSERFKIINDFDSREDFEKMIRAILYFANLPHPRAQSGYGFIGYESKVLASLIGNKRSIQMFYEGDKEEYKRMIVSILRTDSKQYSYTNDFVRDLVRDCYYYIESIFSLKDLEDLALTNFANAINQSDKIEDLLRFYYACETRMETAIGNNQVSLTYPRIKPAKSLIRRFIFLKDLDGFIMSSFTELPFEDSFRLNNFIKDIFKTEELFVWLVKRYQGESVYKNEFLKFYDALNTNDTYKSKGVPLAFFEVIPLSK